MDTPKTEMYERFLQAARDYDGTSPAFRQLMGFKEGIAELRRKKASFETISELLKAEGVNLSWKTVARFCRQYLEPGETGRRRKRRSGARPLRQDGPAVEKADPPSPSERPSISEMLEAQRAKYEGPWIPKRRGPCIADSKNL
jgi:hypothetical protein